MSRDSDAGKTMTALGDVKGLRRDEIHELTAVLRGEGNRHLGRCLVSPGKGMKHEPTGF